ncbi:hypothetical protein CP556_14635 [Natrinema sp. CBA1119]|nr:hypothetical protein CP556_14635 [Natrinema sp. CBA1119]
MLAFVWVRGEIRRSIHKIVIDGPVYQQLEGCIRDVAVSVEIRQAWQRSEKLSKWFLNYSIERRNSRN